MIAFCGWVVVAGGKDWRWEAQAPAGDGLRSGEHRRPGGREGTHPGRVLGVRNVEIPSGSGVRGAGRSTVREVDAVAGTGWSKKRMPVAERRQETGTVHGFLQAGSRITDRIRDEVPGPERVLTWTR